MCKLFVLIFNVTTLTNTHTPETMEISVKKDWVDENDEMKRRPKTIIISLLADDEVCAEYEFNADENWEHVFTNLPVYANGKKIIYSVKEFNVPDGYVEAYEGNQIDGFIVHNGLGQGGDNPPPDNPQTGDNIVSYIIMLIISMIAIISCGLYLKNNN